MTLALLEEGSPADLVLRGFGRDEVLAATGVDVGYNARALRDELAGIDRAAYKVAFVRGHDDGAALDAALAAYACGLDKEGTLRRLGIANQNLMKLKALFDELGMSEQFKEADSAHRRRAMREGMAAKHGADNPFKLDGFQDKARATRKRLYGAEYTMAAGSSLADTARDTFARHMADEAFAAEVAEKRRATCLERYGVESPMQSEEVRQRVRDTCRERYGVDHYSRSDAYKKRVRDTCRQRYGVDSVFEIESAKSKSRETCLERYGVEHWAQTPEARAVQSERMRDGSIRARSLATMLERYGVRYSWESDELLAKMHATVRERYGTDHYVQSEDYRQHLPEIQQRREQTSRERYGTDHYMQSEDYRQHLPEIQQRREQTMRERGSFSASAVENALAAVSGLERQHRDDDRYPHMCDLYDPATDTFVEVNASWTHGRHWFGSSCADAGTLSAWQDKASGSEYYGMAADTWSRRDVAKREHARAAGLSYVTLWDPSGLDSELWVAMGMPSGRDWEREYSWLPDRGIERDVDVSGMTLSWSRLSTVVKDAQRGVFYEHELDLWDENPMRAGKWGTVQAYLYANRWHYLHKLPDALSDREILRAFRISGAYIGFTSFDSEMMRRVIAEHDVRSVYDPCSGWGERMMTCAMLGVAYEGCDVNERLQPGYAKLAAMVDGFEPVLHVGDSATCSVESAPDAIITCPPYADVEVYTERGAENLGADAFFAWWRQVVARCTETPARVFAVQTNQACRQVFLGAMVEAGWSLSYELTYSREKRSHFHRGGGRSKREFESMLVMVR